MGIAFLVFVIIVVALVAYSIGHQDGNGIKQTPTDRTALDATHSSAPKPETIPYFDAFFGLAERLSRRLPLSEWATGTPTSYTPAEIESIDQVRQASSRLMFTTASRYVKEPLQLLLNEIGLINLARELKCNCDEDWGDDIPAEDLEPIVSAYLKAWLCESSPFVLVELADTLVQAGRATEASEAIEVALRFPAYARTKTMDEYELVAKSLAFELFPPGLHWKAHASLTQGIYSPEALALLDEETKRIQQKLNEFKDKSGAKGEGNDRMQLPTIPTDDQLKEIWDAWKKDPEEGILKVLESRQARREKELLEETSLGGEETRSE